MGLPWRRLPLPHRLLPAHQRHRLHPFRSACEVPAFENRVSSEKLCNGLSFPIAENYRSESKRTPPHILVNGSISIRSRRTLECAISHIYLIHKSVGFRSLL